MEGRVNLNSPTAAGTDPVTVAAGAVLQSGATLINDIAFTASTVSSGSGHRLGSGT